MSTASLSDTATIRTGKGTSTATNRCQRRTQVRPDPTDQGHRHLKKANGSKAGTCSSNTKCDYAMSILSGSSQRGEDGFWRLR